MLAIVKPEARPGAELMRVPIPEVGRRDVLVRVQAMSICGSDLHIYQWDRWSAGRLHPPLVFGHEFCGVVEKVGDEVTLVRSGDYVSAEMHVACGECYQCRTGRAHICQRVRILGVDADGCFAEFIRVPEVNIWKVDPAIPVDYAAVFDPLGNAVHTVLAGEVPGLSMAILGCGPIGLFAIGVAKVSGAHPIWASEVHPFRRDLARKMGANCVIDPTCQDPVQIVLGETDGRGAEVVLEMSGNPEAIRQGFQMLSRGGRMSLLGIPSEPVTLNLADDIIFRGALVQGINGRRVFDTWYKMQGLVKSGALDLEPLITERMSMTDFKQGMELLISGEACKVIMYPPGRP